MERRIGKQEDDLTQATVARTLYLPLFGFLPDSVVLPRALVAWESNNWKISMVGKFYEFETLEDKKSN